MRESEIERERCGERERERERERKRAIVDFRSFLSFFVLLVRSLRLFLHSFPVYIYSLVAVIFCIKKRCNSESLSLSQPRRESERGREAKDKSEVVGVFSLSVLLPSLCSQHFGLIFGFNSSLKVVIFIYCTGVLGEGGLWSS